MYAELYDEVWCWSVYPEHGNHPAIVTDPAVQFLDTGDLTAVQCKFFTPKTRATGGYARFQPVGLGNYAQECVREFATLCTISTVNLSGENTEGGTEDQTNLVGSLRVQNLDESSIGWGQLVLAEPQSLTKKPHKTPYDNHHDAIVEDLRTLLLRDDHAAKSIHNHSESRPEPRSEPCVDAVRILSRHSHADRLDNVPQPTSSNLHLVSDASWSDSAGTVRA